MCDYQLMKVFYKSILFLVISLGIFFVSTSSVSAHQPRIPGSFPVAVDNPEISKAYYAKTDVNSEVYNISSDKTFDFYVNILVPDITNQNKDLFVTVIQKGTKDKQIAYLDGTKFEWTKMFEPFGHDNYLQGPEFRFQAPAGKYEIKISGKIPGTKYSLATGEVESFGFSNSLEILSIIPKLKVDFFNKSPIDFLLSPIGAGYAVIVIILSFIFGFILSLIMRKFAKGKGRRKVMNIGAKDRIIRLVLAIALFLLAVSTTWNGILIFAAGFCLFEAIFSWCGLFALMGKNTCPV